MIVDAYSHIYPKEFVKTLLSYQYGFPFVSGQIDPAFSHYVEPEPRIKHLDKFGIDMQVLTITSPPLSRFAGAEAMKVARIANQGISRIVSEHPDRFVGVGVLPLFNVNAALDEFDRAIGELGLKGMLILSNIAGKPLDSEEFLPVYEKAAKYDAPIYIHPSDWEYYSWIQEYKLHHIFGWPFDTALAMARLVFGGVMERYPNIKFVTHHLGSMIPYFAQRVRTFYDQGLVYPGMATNAKVSKNHPMEYFKMFYNDTGVYGWKPSLMLAHAFFGPEKILYGTDYPMGPEEGLLYLGETLHSVKEMDIPNEEKNKILGDNAIRMLKIERT